MPKSPKSPKETPAERASADIGLEQHSLSERLAPIRDDLNKRLSNYRAEKQTLANRSTADVAAAYSGSGPKAVQGNAAGAAPAVALSGLDRGVNAAKVAVNTRQRGVEGEVDALTGLASMARGEGADAIVGLDRLAADANAEAVNRARTSSAKQTATSNAIAGAAGIGLAKYGSFGGTDDGSTAVVNQFRNARPIG